MKELNLLGLKCKDKVTGATGVITSISFELYGCIQALVKPLIKEDGTMPDGFWFDLNRLEIISKKPVMKSVHHHIDKGGDRMPLKS